MKVTNKKGFWIGIALSALFLWLAFRKVNFGELGVALKSANYLWVAFAAMLNGLSFVLRAYRWQFILRPVKQTHFGNAFAATTIGFMANSILPARLGEFIRAFVIGNTEGISKSASFATIIVERVFDMFVLFFPFFGFLVVLPLPEVLKRGAWWALGATFLILGILVFLEIRPNYIHKFVRLFPQKYENKFTSFLSSFIGGLKILRNWKTLTLIFMQSIIIWGWFALVYWVLIKAFNLNLPPYAAFIIMVIVSLGIILPSSPGFVGTYHYFVVIGLGIFQVSKSISLSFAIISHLVAFVPVVLIGLVCLQRLNFSLRETKERL